MGTTYCTIKTWAAKAAIRRCGIVVKPSMAFMVHYYDVRGGFIVRSSEWIVPGTLDINE